MAFRSEQDEKEFYEDLKTEMASAALSVGEEVESVDIQDDMLVLNLEDRTIHVHIKTYDH